MKRAIKGKHIIWVAVALLVMITATYRTWNSIDPVNTCAQCHEIAPSHDEWMLSAHAGVQCIECHGTAFSNGLHSLKEKTRMIYVHITENKHNEDIYLTEEQVLEFSGRCTACHQSEYAGWLSSGHAVNYREIFMDSTHNAMEKPYWDCFRCHGMFYNGNINTLMNLDGKYNEWFIKDKKQWDRPTVPCLSCHKIHTDNPVSNRYVPMNASTDRPERNPRSFLYIRADKLFLRSDQLTPIVMRDGECEVTIADDPNTMLCMQCHAPNFLHHAGSEDDRTPTGVHQGIGCITCHKSHSGDTRESCNQCHPAMSNCGLDVMSMNTSFKDPQSPNNIHSITCTSCHKDRRNKIYF